MDVGSARVLVVDDDPDVAWAIGELIRDNGYFVECLTDASEAMAKAADFNPHCVVFDIRMPRVDGVSLSRQFRERYGDDVVLIAITGFDGRSPDVAAVFDTADHYLQKPVDIAQLNKVLPPL